MSHRAGLNFRATTAAAARLLIHFALFLLTISVFVPWNMHFPVNDVDGSWAIVLNWAHTSQLDFGKDIVFTYGPLGFLTVGQVPTTFWLLVLGWTLCAAAFFAGISAVAGNSIRRFWVGAIWMFAVILLAGSYRLQMEDVRVFALSWLLLVYHFYVDDRPQGWVKNLLVVAIAMASLIKFSMLLMAMAVLPLVAIDLILRRKFPWPVVIYLGAFLVFWLMAGQHLGSLAGYFSHSWSITSGYPAGEEVFQSTELFDVAIFALCALLLVVPAALASGGRRRLLFVLGLLACVFFVFKTGFVRHDLHEITATTALAILAFLCLPVIWKASNRWTVRSMTIVAVLASVLLAWDSDQKWGREGLPQYLAQVLTDFPSRSNIAATWLTSDAAMSQNYLDQLQPLREDRLPPVNGSVDIYACDQRLVIAQGLDYRPRPVFQSYLAYNDELDRLNADFLRGPNAPDTVFFNVWALDHQYLSQADGLSWPELLTRYDLKDASHRWLVLERSQSPRSYTLEPLAQQNVRMGDWVLVPASDDPVWVKITPRLTILGKIVSAAFKPPPLEIGVKTFAGGIVYSRLLPAIGDSGFLLSPLIADQISFALLGSDQWRKDLQNQLVSSICVRVDNSTLPAGCYEDQCDVQFFSLKFPHTDISAVSGIEPYLKAQAFLSRLHVIFASEPPQLFAASPGNLVVVAPAPSDLLIDAPPRARTVHITFGMLDSSYTAKEKTDGVTFQVFAITGASGKSLAGGQLWSRTLHPDTAPDDRGPQEVFLKLPASHPVALLLKCVAGPSRKAPYSYWSRVDFQ